jgi:hypothetical protein
MSPGYYCCNGLDFVVFRGGFTVAERVPGTHWIGGRVGRRVGLEAVKKKSCTAGNLTRAVAIPTQLLQLLEITIPLRIR